MFREIQHLINSNLFDKFGDVRYQYHSALVVVEGGGDDGDVAEVDVVRRFIEDEEAGAFHR